MKKIFLVVPIFFLTGISFCQKINFLNSPEAKSFHRPFSEAVRVGNILYLSGQLGTLPGTDKLIPGGIVPETEQTMQNIKAVLEKYGSSLDSIFKCTCMLADIKEWKDMSIAYAKFFKTDLPARSAFAGTGLWSGARVEIECWAKMKDH